MRPPSTPTSSGARPPHAHLDGQARDGMPPGARIESGDRRYGGREASARARDGERVPEKNIKTVSVLLGHADASYTLNLYLGFTPATTRELANRYVDRLIPGLMDG